MPRRFAPSCLALCAWSLVSCAASLPPAAAADPARGAAPLTALDYHVGYDPATKRLAVELCFRGQPPERLVHGAKSAVPFVREPQLIEPPLHAANGKARVRALTVQADHLQLGAAAPNSCVRYGVDVQRALDVDALMLAYPGERSVLLGSELFLWRPPVRSLQLQSRLRFVLPKGVRVSAPWALAPERDGSYVLDERAFAFTGHVVLGELEPLSISAPGTVLRAVIMPGFSAAARTQISAWLERSATIASMPGGVFPVPNAQVIVVPTSLSSFPIHFGHTGRSGGASVVLFVPTDVEQVHLQDDWIAIHEFSHLWHPFIRREDAWLSEGLATYLQEVLRVRAGIVPAELAWQRLYEGAELGRDSARTLQEETRRMPFEHNYQRVYWAGAAIALMLDVELRQRSGGAVTLPQLLARLRSDQLLFMRALSAAELLHELDRVSGFPLCEELAARHVHGTLPDLGSLYQQLGIRPPASGSKMPAPLTWVRDAIMAEPAG
jgi:hypothetical protein